MYERVRGAKELKNTNDTVPTRISIFEYRKATARLLNELQKTQIQSNNTNNNNENYKIAN